MSGFLRKNREGTIKKDEARFESFKTEKLSIFNLDTDELSRLTWDVIVDYNDNECCQLLMAYSTLRLFDESLRMFPENFDVSNSVEDYAVEALFNATEEHDEANIYRCNWILLALLLRVLGTRCDLDEDDVEYLAASWLKMSEASAKMNAVMKINILWEDEEKKICLADIFFTNQHSTNTLRSFAPMEKIQHTLAFESFLEENRLRYVYGCFLPPLDLRASTS